MKGKVEKAKSGSKAPSQAACAAHIDSLFASLPKRSTSVSVASQPPPARRKAGAVAGAAPRAAGEGRGVAKRSRAPPGEADVYLETGEKLVPVSMPRRFQDGVPIFKSFGAFSDLAATNVPPEGAKPGKCPFDCWCCM